MNRQQKEHEVGELKQLLHDAKATFLVQYQGLNVPQVFALRSKLRGDNGVFRVSKARLMKIAANDSFNESFMSQFKGQVALVFALEDVPAVAKKIVEFSKEHDALKVVSGYFESKALSRDEVIYLASIPSREVLLAQLCGVMQAPLVGFARVLQAPLVQLVLLLKALEDKQGQEHVE